MRFNIYILPPHTDTTLTSLTIFPGGGEGGRWKEVGKKDAFLQITSPRNVIRLKEVYWDLTKK